MTDFLSADYWNNRYAEAQTQWDLKEVSPPLKTYFDQIIDKNISILIPGCGNAHEVEYLESQGFTDITVLDISEMVVKNLQKKFEKKPSIKVLFQDFFTHDGQYDLIVEQTFFCALSPTLRPDYVLKMKKLLKPTGKLAGLLFGKQFEENPPFGGSVAEYEALFKPHFTFHTLEKCYNSVNRRAGTELFINFRPNDLTV